MMVTANWSGRYPNLCRGSWDLVVDGINYTWAIPEELREKPMNTRGTYERWHFVNWQEEWDSYADGLDYADWCAANPWIRSIPAPATLIYSAFQRSDWRYDSCGGCI